MNIFEDMHVHSTFSDGQGSIQENIHQAELRGLRRLGCVDHVRADTKWLPEFVEAIRVARSATNIELICGIEAKLLTVTGELDIPTCIDGVDRIYAADHQMPSSNGCLRPPVVRDMLKSGETSPLRVIADIVESYVNIMLRNPGKIVIAHAFSILPKLRLSEELISDGQLRRLGHCAALTNNVFEIDERWSCPGYRSVDIISGCGAEVWCSTDSHLVKDIGLYAYTKTLLRRLLLERSGLAEGPLAERVAA